MARKRGNIVSYNIYTHVALPKSIAEGRSRSKGAWLRSEDELYDVCTELDHPHERLPL